MTSLLTRPDFRDWLSPMLVKELRQGMRSRIFMAAFFLTQVLMILSTIMSLTASEDGDFSETSILDGVFWFLVAVPVMLLTPIRGFGALHGEIKERTLELVFLTRLSALRIAAGKWTALMAQSLLLVCSILPYVLLRYFLGGVNILAELQGLLIMIVMCGVLTALTVAMSPYESKLLRGLLVIGLFIGFIVLLANYFEITAMGPAIGSSVISFYMTLALFVPAMIFLALEMAASRIAPAAENHAIRKRLIGIYFAMVGASLLWFKADTAEVIKLVLTIVSLVAIDAMAEQQEFTRTVYRPFLKRGPAGRFLALFLTPGWVSGSWYVLLLAVICGVGIVRQENPGNELTRLALFGSLIFPSALIRLFLPRTHHFLGLYIASQFFFGAIFLLLNIPMAMSGQAPSAWLCPIPNCVFFLSYNDKIQPGQLASFLTVTAAVTMASMVVLLGRTLAPLRDIRAALRQNPGTDA